MFSLIFLTWELFCKIDFNECFHEKFLDAGIQDVSTRINMTEKFQSKSGQLEFEDLVEIKN